MLALVVFMLWVVNIPRKERGEKKILPQSLNFVIRTKQLFTELQRPFVPMAFMFRLYNN